MHQSPSLVFILLQVLYLLLYLIDKFTKLLGDGRVRDWSGHGNHELKVIMQVLNEMFTRMQILDIEYHGLDELTTKALCVLGIYRVERGRITK